MKSLILTTGLAFLLGACQKWMMEQPRYDTYSSSEYYPDGSSARQYPEGTLARGARTPQDDQRDVKATTIPLKLTSAILERGRERYGIYCAVCHSPAGDGEGIVTQRGFPHPPTYHQDRLRQAPAGHIYDVITHGYGRMFRLGDRLKPEDRWAIVAYVRALQLSQNAPVKSLTDNQRRRLEGDSP